MCTPSFNGLTYPLLKKCFSDLNANGALKSSGLAVQLKLKCLLMETTHEDMIEAKEHSTVFKKIRMHVSVAYLKSVSI